MEENEIEAISRGDNLEEACQILHSFLKRVS